METISPIFQSLNDESRLRILSLLLSEGELCVCDLVAVLQLPQSTVSRQISLLKSAGWLKDRRDGIWIFYSISTGLSPIQQFILPVLHNFLPVTAVAKSDIERLHRLSSGNRCA
jgi:ArsR family transcriptional regulator